MRRSSCGCDWRRWLLRTAIYTLILTTVVHGALLTIPADIHGNATVAGRAAQVFSDRDGQIAWSNTGSWPLSRIYIHPVHQSITGSISLGYEVPVGYQLTTRDILAIDPPPDRSMPSWAERLWSPRFAGASWHGTYIGCGFPFICFGAYDMETSFAHQVQMMNFPVPMQPMRSYFEDMDIFVDRVVLNLLVWFLAVGAVRIMFAGVPWQVRRLMRGRCPVCGYALHEPGLASTPGFRAAVRHCFTGRLKPDGSITTTPGCPECGWNHQGGEPQETPRRGEMQGMG